MKTASIYPRAADGGHHSAQQYHRAGCAWCCRMALRLLGDSLRIRQISEGGDEGYLKLARCAGSGTIC